MAISSALGGAGAVPVGVVNPFAGANAPSGWLLCYGQAVSRTGYPVLFSTLSTIYGSGDGSTTFNIPDMRGRVVAGEDDMGGTAASRLTSAVSGLNGATLGATGGNQIMHAHSHANTASFSGSFTGTGASHNHGQDAHSHGIQRSNVTASSTNTDGSSIYQLVQNSGAGYSTTQTSTATNQATSITPAGTISGTVTMTNATFPETAGGSSQNVQPTIVLNYIIKAL